MATGGSYNPSTFAQQTPFETWAQVQGIGLYWDTENQFAAGKQGVSRARFGGPGATEGTIRRPNAPGGNYLGGYGQKQINIGGRNYGDQPIDRGELERLGSGTMAVANPLLQLFGSWRERQIAAKTYPTNAGAGGTGGRRPRGTSPSRPGGPTLSSSATPVPPPPSPSASFLPPGAQPNVPPPPGGPAWTPPPPQPKPFPAPTVPTAVSPTPHRLATSNWQEEQAQRIAEYELGEPGQPTPDVSLGSRTYQQQVAERRASRQAARASAGSTFGFPPPPGSTQPSPLAPPPPGSQRPAPIGFPEPPAPASATSAPTSRAARRPSGLGSAGREIFAGLRGEVAPSPTSPVGDQSARLMAEGTVIPGGPEMTTETETRGARSLARPLTRPLTRSLTNTPTGSGGATAQRGVPEGRSTARSPRRKR